MPECMMIGSRPPLDPLTESLLYRWEGKRPSLESLYLPYNPPFMSINHYARSSRQHIRLIVTMQGLQCRGSRAGDNKATL